jgi:hypothetical protein
VLVDSSQQSVPIPTVGNAANNGNNAVPEGAPRKANAENLGQLVELRREADKQGLDPNVWFGNVESVVSERIGREKVTYVSNIYKYYVDRLVVEENERRATAKGTIKSGKDK